MDILFYLWGVRTATYIPTLETSQECERQNHNPMLCLPGWGGVEGTRGLEASRDRVKDARIKRGDWQGQIPRGSEEGGPR